MEILKKVRLLGLVITVTGLIVFTLSLGMSHFQLTEETLREVVKKESHFKALKAELAGDFGKTWTSKSKWLNNLQSAVARVNANKAYKTKIKGYSYSTYLFKLTKKSSTGILVDHLGLIFLFSLGAIFLGGLIFILPGVRTAGPAGIKNNGIFHSSLMSRGVLGVIAGTYLIGFYIFLYWYPEWITNWVLLVDPLSRALSGNEASHWFLYGVLYTFGVLVMGTRMLIKYRHSTYQKVRTCSVMFFQTALAFLIPEILVRLNKPYFDFKNIWPLDYDFFFSWNIKSLIADGGLGVFMLGWGTALTLVGVPLFTYLYGKRWYCSWVCGCGGLAETVGDPFRQLSDKTVKSWRIERILIHSVLIFAIVMTAITLINFFSDYKMLGNATYSWQKTYGFLIGSAFSGVVGTGFYPMMGNRVWCRFGCPLAAYLGLVQRFRSRFRITTNGAQCISCGNCSTYCEMGIDVRHYAQRGQNIVRSSCVGCGVCSSVCPRGVLTLENGPNVDRMEPISINDLIFEKGTITEKETF